MRRAPKRGTRRFAYQSDLPQSILQLAGETRGCLAVRGESEWVVLPPGPEGHALLSTGLATECEWGAIPTPPPTPFDGDLGGASLTDSSRSYVAVAKQLDVSGPITSTGFIAAASNGRFSWVGDSTVHIWRATNQLGLNAESIIYHDQGASGQQFRADRIHKATTTNSSAFANLGWMNNGGNDSLAANGRAKLYSVLIVGIASAGTHSGKSFACRIEGLFSRTGGIVSQIGATEKTTYGDEPAAGWDAQFSISGTSIRVQVKGDAASTVKWTGATISILATQSQS